jgi:F0F1-type ATP synthase membrane subunit b/b'
LEKAKEEAQKLKEEATKKVKEEAANKLKDLFKKK